MAMAGKKAVGAGRAANGKAAIAKAEIAGAEGVKVMDGIGSGMAIATADVNQGIRVPRTEMKTGCL
jgi:hypothetical protein